MKKLLIFISFSIFISVSSFAQLNVTEVINKDDIELEDSAILQLNSIAKGFLMPRMTDEQRLDIEDPVAGLQVFVTDFNNGKGAVMFYNGEEWTALADLITCPDPPTDVQATIIGTQEATVTFTAPENNGGSTITQYTATSKPDEFSKTIVATEVRSITISGLDQNEFYTFTVTATNIMGSSIASEFSNIVPDPEIGDSLFGGMVFYILNNLDPGHKTGETHGLICALEDLEDTVKWHPDSFALEEVTGTSEQMDYGKANTKKIIDKLGTNDTNYAAYQATLYNVDDGYTGWYLPSKDELNRIYLNLKEKTTIEFRDDSYWSSSEKGKFDACRNHLGNNDQRQLQKTNDYWVRPVRSF